MSRKNVIRLTLLSLLVALALSLMLPTTSLAQRAPPHVFVGMALIDGASAPNGTVLTAWVDGREVASATVMGGNYSLIVDEGDSTFAGKTVFFRLGNSNAAETAIWFEGGGDELNLSAGSGSASPVGESTTVSTAGAAGPRGPAGPAGASGPAGATGSAGPSGASGAAGPAGETGAAGPSGASGSAGPAGASGSAGPRGATGSAGPAGATGSAGQLGIAGDDALMWPAWIAVAIAIAALVGSIIIIRRTSSGSAVLITEVHSLRQQLREAQELVGLRENLILAEYQAKAEKWETDGFNVGELRRLLSAYEENK